MSAERPLPIWAYASCAALAIGSTGQWASGPIGYDGLSGDGSITLGAAVLGALAVWRWTASRRRMFLAFAQVVAVLCIALLIYDLLDIRDYYTTMDASWTKQVGWGLILALGAEVSFALSCAFLGLSQRNRLVYGE